MLKITDMTIQEAIAQCQNIQDDQEKRFEISYEGKSYELSATMYGTEHLTKPEPLLAVYANFMDGMNVKKVTKQYITLYTFDMMDQRSTYKMALDKIRVIKETTRR